ncbi:MAG: 7-cyano-7-deazaguanine synthase [Chloroflexota bacterium]|nr:7-cyano-7-deazaguanine synthase [Chloroflexota bacterium]
MALPVTVLASGGLDSATCLAYYLQQRMSTQALWVSYGQRAARVEEKAIERIVAHYQVPLQKLRVEGVSWPEIGGDLFEFRGRNLTLASLALNASPPEGGLIALGVHHGARFPDCGTAFVEQLDRMLMLLSSGRVRLDCPFLEWGKEEVASYAVSLGVPVDLTYSCERGTVPACGECVKCRDRATLTKLSTVS